jgi:hypothetical protein
VAGASSLSVGRPAANSCKAARNSPFLRHEANAEPRDTMGRQSRYIDAFKNNFALARRRQTDDAAHGGGFTDTVAADQSDHLTGFDL